MLASLGRPSLRFIALLTAGLSLTAPRSAQAQFQKQYKIIDLADDVFAIVWEDLFAYPVEGNHLVVIGEDGVVVVDANRTPSLTDTVIAIIRERTSKPVRHVINTHWHADHVQGNSVYLREFPDVQILGHPETVAGIDTVLVPWVAEVRSEVVRLGSELEADTTEEGTPLTEEQRQRLKAQLARYERESKLYDAVRLAHPTLLVTDSVVITSGNRKIVVIYPGHANTPGDLMVYLPSEGIIAVGDIVTKPFPLMGWDSPTRWPAALDNVLAREPTVVVPGHGEVLYSMEYVELFRDFFRSVTTQVQEGIAAGRPLEDITEAVDLDRFWRAFAGEDDRMYQAMITRLEPRVVERTYGELRR